MSHGSPQPSSAETARPFRRQRDVPGLFDLVRVRSAVPEHGIKAGDQGTVVELFTGPEGYLVDFSDEPGYGEHELPVYVLTGEWLEVVQAASLTNAGHATPSV